MLVTSWILGPTIGASLPRYSSKRFLRMTSRRMRPWSLEVPVLYGSPLKRQEQFSAWLMERWQGKDERIARHHGFCSLSIMLILGTLTIKQGDCTKSKLNIGQSRLLMVELFSRHLFVYKNYRFLCAVPIALKDQTL